MKRILSFGLLGLGLLMALSAAKQPLSDITRTLDTLRIPAGVDPNDENEYVTVGEMNGFTFSQEAIAAVGHATHIAPVFTHQGAGYASLSLVALEYDGAEAKG
jgi:hypothetical protein